MSDWPSFKKVSVEARFACMMNGGHDWGSTGFTIMCGVCHVEASEVGETEFPHSMYEKDWQAAREWLWDHGQWMRDCQGQKCGHVGCLERGHPW